MTDYTKSTLKRLFHGNILAHYVSQYNCDLQM